MSICPRHTDISRSGSAALKSNQLRAEQRTHTHMRRKNGAIQTRERRGKVPENEKFFFFLSLLLIHSIRRLSNRICVEKCHVNVQIETSQKMYI